MGSWWRWYLGFGLVAVFTGVLLPVLPRQGHYASEPGWESKYRAPDLVIERIGDLKGFDPAALAADRTF